MIQMIHEDCAECEMLDLENEDFPCKLEEYGSIIRCNILKEYVERLELKNDF